MRVHFQSIFLADESDGNKFGNGEKFEVSMFDDSVTCRPEDDSFEVDALGLSGDLRFGVFAGPHGKEVGPCDDIGCNGWGGVFESWVIGSSEEFAQESRCDRFLVTRRGVYIVEGFEQGLDGWVHVLASLEVNGAWLEIVPKRRSQTACGTSQSACDQWLWMSTFQSSCDAPLSRSIEAEEGSKEEDLGVFG
jgi:hypothetical protein